MTKIHKGLDKNKTFKFRALHNFYNFEISIKNSLVFIETASTFVRFKQTHKPKLYIFMPI